MLRAFTKRKGEGGFKKPIDQEQKPSKERKCDKTEKEEF